EKQDCVSIMTMHAAKGLEFPVVFLAGIEQGLIPHERSLHKDDEIEEERRLCFVGMTRAREELYLTHARLREFRGQTLYAVPSMFLGELPPHVVDNVYLSSQGGAVQQWRSGNEAALQAWADAGVDAIPLPLPPRKPADQKGYAEG